MNPADPLASGFIASLARPGGNATGTTGPTVELISKRLEVLREIAPRPERVAFVAMQKGVSPSLDKTNQIKFDAAAATAKALGMTMTWRPVPTSRDLDGLFRMIAADGDQALYVVFDPLTIQGQRRIAELALSHKIPAVFEIRDYVVSGGLVSYTYLRAHNFERAAVFIDKILKGANPAEIPVEQPTKFELVVNFEDREGARPRNSRSSFTSIRRPGTSSRRYSASPTPGRLPVPGGRPTGLSPI